MLSGTSHGEFWTSSLSIEEVDAGEEEEIFMGTSLHVEHLMWLAVHVTEWFAKSSWQIFVVSGWDMKALAAILERTYNSVGFNSDARFWRKDYLTLVRP